MDVLLNDFRRQWGAISSDASAVLERVASSGWYVLGDEVSAFERRLARHWGVQHCVGVGNGLDAIEIALNAAYCMDVLQVLECPTVELQLRDANAQTVLVPVDDDPRLEEYIYVVMPMRL